MRNRMVNFKKKLATRLVAQLRDLHPENTIEARFSAFDLSTIRFHANDHEQLEKEEALIREVLSMVSTERRVENNGRIVTFKPLPIDVDRAVVEWKRVRKATIRVAKTSLKTDYVWNKISELMEEEIRGADIEEEETDAQQNVRVDSQMRFWIEFLNRYTPTNTISNFKFFVYLLLVIPSNTAGLEWMFKNLKRMKSKIRNRLGEDRTRKLMMIMNFIDDVEFDLGEIAAKFKDKY